MNDVFGWSLSMGHPRRDGTVAGYRPSSKIAESNLDDFLDRRKAVFRVSDPIRRRNSISPQYNSASMTRNLWYEPLSASRKLNQLKLRVCDPVSFPPSPETIPESSARPERPGGQAAAARASSLIRERFFHERGGAGAALAACR
jgi:hypothetical protein